MWHARTIQRMCDRRKDNGQSEHAEGNINRIISDSKKLAEGYRVLYEEAEKEEQLDTLEFRQQATPYLGEAGYSAVDLENRIDMTHAEQETFCRAAENKKERRGDDIGSTVITVDL